MKASSVLKLSGAISTTMPAAVIGSITAIFLYRNPTLLNFGASAAALIGATVGCGFFGLKMIRASEALALSEELRGYEILAYETLRQLNTLEDYRSFVRAYGRAYAHQTEEERSLVLNIQGGWSPHDDLHVRMRFNVLAERWIGDRIALRSRNIRLLARESGEKTNE